MGAWGPSLYADDTTTDVRDDYIASLKRGDSDVEATRHVLKQFKALLRNREIQCLVYFALADTQWQYGRLDHAVKQQALMLLAKGGDAGVWVRDAGKAAGAARTRHLLALKTRLLKKAPPRKVVRVVKRKDKLVLTTAPIGTVFLAQLSKLKYGALVLIGYSENDSAIEPVFSALNWSGGPRPTKGTLNKIALRGRVPFSSGLGPHTQVGLFELDNNNPIAPLIQAEVVIDRKFRFDPCGFFSTGLQYVVADLMYWFKHERVPVDSRCEKHGMRRDGVNVCQHIREAMKAGGEIALSNVQIDFEEDGAIIIDTLVCHACIKSLRIKQSAPVPGSYWRNEKRFPFMLPTCRVCARRLQATKISERHYVRIGTASRH
jgi:hypothetical protein